MPATSSFWQTPRTWVVAGVVVLALLLLHQLWIWEVERVEVPPGHSLVLINLWGKNLPDGEILAPDEGFQVRGEWCRAQGAGGGQRLSSDPCGGGPVASGAEQGVGGPVFADGGPVLVTAVVPRGGGGVPGLGLGPAAELAGFGAGHRRERGLFGE